MLDLSDKFDMFLVKQAKQNDGAKPATTSNQK